MATTQVDNEIADTVLPRLKLAEESARLAKAQTDTNSDKLEAEGAEVKANTDGIKTLGEGASRTVCRRFPNTAALAAPSGTSTLHGMMRAVLRHLKPRHPRGWPRAVSCLAMPASSVCLC